MRWLVWTFSLPLLHLLHWHHNLQEVQLVQQHVHFSIHPKAQWLSTECWHLEQNPRWLNHGKYCMSFVHYTWTCLMVVVVIHHCCEGGLLGWRALCSCPSPFLSEASFILTVPFCLAEQDTPVILIQEHGWCKDYLNMQSICIHNITYSDNITSYAALTMSCGLN